MSAVYDGIARSALRWFTGFIRERVPANLGWSLASTGRFQEITGRIESLLLSTGLLSQRPVMLTTMRVPAPLDSGIVKVTVTNNTIAAVELMLQASGNPGLSRSNPLERHYRNEGPETASRRTSASSSGEKPASVPCWR